MPQYAPEYCRDSRNYRKHRCDHPDVVIYDLDFPAIDDGHPSRAQFVCEVCGRIGKWVPIHFCRSGAYFMPRF